MTKIHTIILLNVCNLLRALQTWYIRSIYMHNHLKSHLGTNSYWAPKQIKHLHVCLFSGHGPMEKL